MKITPSKPLAPETDSSKLSPLHIPHTRDQTWENWGRTARCRPQFSFTPQRVEELIQIVNFARQEGLKIRVAAHLRCDR